MGVPPQTHLAALAVECLVRDPHHLTYHSSRRFGRYYLPLYGRP